ncbi:MAG: hypothetical protein AB7I27_05415 [Bacteriovoracaceae bacterium]
MRLLTLLLILIFIGCSHSPERDLAAISDEIITWGEIDKSKSVVTLFPPDLRGDRFRYNFYLQLRDAKNQFVDCDEKDIVLKDKKGKKYTFKLERVLKGRYYVTLESQGKLLSSEVSLSVQNHILREELKLKFTPPDKKMSKITIVSEEMHRMTFELTLADSKGKAITSQEKPEIILDGSDASIEDLHQLKEGVWRFNLVFSEQNHVIYISVKSNGAYLERLFRFHYVDKLLHGSTW